MAFTPKYLRSLPPVALGGRQVKRYQVTIDDRPLDPVIQNAAEDFLPKLYPDFADDTPPATVLVLHQGMRAMYLCAYNWVWDNAVHTRGAVAGDQPYLGSHTTDLTSYTEIDKRLVGCVWELPVLAHERSAWVRHLLAPDEPDLAAYLADAHPDGPVGQP